MDKTAELLDRIAALELRVAELEARPQPAQTISHGGMWSWPWPQGPYNRDGTQNVSRETLDEPKAKPDLPRQNPGFVP